MASQSSVPSIAATSVATAASAGAVVIETPAPPGSLQRTALRPVVILPLVGRSARHFVAIAVTILFGFPLVWMLSTSLKTGPEVFILPPRWIPWSFQVENYGYVWASPLFQRYLLNSVITVSATVLLQAVTVPTAAYAFAILRFPGRDVLFVLFLGAMMIPVQATIFPSFLLLSALRWVDTYLALTIPFGASAFGVFLLRQAFLSVPQDLVDAAKMDGARHLQILLQVLVPIARPMLLTFLLLSATWRWNDYFWPLVMTATPEMRTLPVGVAFLHSSEGPSRWHIVTAASVITIAPTLLLFAALQRQFVDGLTRTGIKG